LSADELLVLVVSLGTVAIAYGLAYWVFRAGQDRSARVGLYLLFGIPGVLLIVFGSAYAVNGRDWGWTALAVGLGLSLPLVPTFRKLYALWTPMDAKSAVDMSGLCVVLAIIGFLFVSYVVSPEPVEAGSETTIAAFLVQFLAEIAFAYILVGTLITRTFRQSTARLGLTVPSLATIGIALAMVVVGLIVVAIGGALTTVFQPDVSRDISRITDELTSDVQNPIGAVLFGLGAGAGEELLLRGAVQPRFGLLTTSVLFGLLHNQYGVSFVLLGIFSMGVILGLERKYLGTTAAIITHAVFNMIVVLI
jgi:membrane protease YdiL (CAAX protease family)